MLFKVPINLPRNLGSLSTLYFIESGDFVKIGIADDLPKRLAVLQLGNPIPLRVAARRTIPKCLAKQVEARVHAALADSAVGREWFRGRGQDAARVADPFVKKAHATILRWRSNGIDLGTGRALTPHEVGQLFETGGIVVVE